MTIPIEEMPLAPEDAMTLRQAGIATNDDFWLKMAADPEFLSKVFTRPVPRARVFSLMVREGVEEAQEIVNPQITRIIPDLCVIVIVSLFVYGLGRDRQVQPPNLKQQVVVTAKDGLQPFHVISSGDVALQMRAFVKDSVTRLDDVIGRYSSRFLNSGTVISSIQLSRGPKLQNELRQRKFLQIRMLPSALLTGINTPLKISLIASPRVASADKGKVLDDVLLLSETPGSDGSVSAVVAVTNSDASLLAPLLGTSDFIPALPGG